MCAVDEVARLAVVERLLAIRLDTAGGRRWDQLGKKPKQQGELRPCRRAGGDTESMADGGHAGRSVVHNGKQREMPKPDYATERYS